MNSIAHIKPRLGQFTLYKPQSYLQKKSTVNCSIPGYTCMSKSYVAIEFIP